VRGLYGGSDAAKLTAAEIAGRKGGDNHLVQWQREDWGTKSGRTSRATPGSKIPINTALPVMPTTGPGIGRSKIWLITSPTSWNSNRMVIVWAQRGFVWVIFA